MLWCTQCRCVGAGCWFEKAMGAREPSTISLLGTSWVRTRQFGSGCMQGDAGKINGYVISLLLSQIGSGGGGAAELKK